MKFFAKFSLLILLIAPFSAFSQKYQIALSAGPALLYVVEDAATSTDYFYGMAYQNEFIFLNENSLPNFGFSLTSSSAVKYIQLYENYRIDNTQRNGFQIFFASIF